jgi:hypothetical protein
LCASYLLALKQYESEIIADILNEIDNENFNLRARLQHSQSLMTEIFLGFMFDKYEIKEQVILFINKKTEISKSILQPYFSDNYLRANEWKELYEKNIFNKETKQKVIYLSLLMEFEENNYPPLPDNVSGYRAGCIFVSHEWKNKDKKSEFLSFAEREKILSIKELEDITEKFEHNIQENSTFNFRFGLD